MGWTFNYSVNNDIIKTTTIGSGTVSQSNSKCVLQTGAVVNSSAKVETREALRYYPGVGAIVRVSALFSSGGVGSSQLIGVGDEYDGYFFGFNGATFGVLRRQNGIDNWTPQAGWNGDKLDGSGNSGISINPLAGNIYTIEYQWLGFGTVTFWAANPNTGDPVLAHTILYGNANTDPSILNPTLPIMAKVTNTTNNTNIILQTAAAMGFVEGSRGVHSIFTRNSVTGSKTAVTTEVPIISIRNKTAFQTKNNRVRIRLDWISAATDGNKSVTFRLRRNGTLGGIPSWTEVSTNTSVVEYDTSATSVSGGLILTF